MGDNQTKLNEFLAIREAIRERMQVEYIADNVHVGDFTFGIPQIEYWDDGTQLFIGKFCSIANNVIFTLGGNHRTDWASMYAFNSIFPSFGYISGHPQSNGDIIVGNDVWIAGGVKILSGVTIGDGAVIGANSLVTKDVEPYSIVTGIPASKKKDRFDEATKERFLEMKWWDWPDEMIVEAIPLLQSDRFDELWKYYRQSQR